MGHGDQGVERAWMEIEPWTIRNLESMEEWYGAAAEKKRR